MRPLAILAATAALLVTAPAALAAPAAPAAPAAARPVPAARDQHPGSAQAQCAKPARRHAACLSFRRTDVAHPRGVQAQFTPFGYGPTDVTSAYALPSGGGDGETVAITIAYDNPHLESDLATYRQQYGLPPCTSANGCLRKLDQRGGTDYPVPDENWGGEADLDVQMVSAVCPACHILVVEADDSTDTNLFAAVDQAVAQGAQFVSNSWGGPEDPEAALQYDAHFDHPGVAFTVASGDTGFGLEYPAFSRYVTAVGGTSLYPASNDRGWTETAWSGAGAGCTDEEPKPSWQDDPLCRNRMETDVSAVADPNTGVAVYDQGWQVYGGTSVASPIIAGVYALAGPATAGHAPNSYPYGDPSALNDVTSGSDGYCPSAPYFCTAGPGYDGPTGLGTPNGVSAFRYGPHGQVVGTVRDASTGAPVAGAAVRDGQATAISDNQGRYALSVPLGASTVSVTDFGYRTWADDIDITADGQQLTLDVPLTALPRVTVRGTLADGSGHGWPLYGTVQVDGQPATVVHTDPATGAYRLSVPAGAAYTLDATVAYPGYRPVRQPISVGDTDQSVDLTATVDEQACDAPGYTVRITPVLRETFDSSPPGWTTKDSGSGMAWTFDGGYAGVTGTGDAYQWSSLTSPAIDLTGVGHPVLTMRTDQDAGTGGSTAQVFAGSDQVWFSSSDDHESPTVDLSALAGKAGVTVQFVYTDAYSGGWWHVDDVVVGDRACVAAPGGLVIGSVTDGNTGAPLPKATVDARAVLPDGRYAVFEPAGTRSVTATAPDGYQPVTDPVPVTDDRLATADFALPAGQLRVNPAAVSGSTVVGATSTTSFTITNTGTAAAAVTVHPSATDSTTGEGAPRVTGAKVSPTHQRRQLRAAGHPSATPFSPPWTASADYPVLVADAAAATGSDGIVYSVGGLSPRSADGVLAAGWALDPRAATWTRLPDMPDERYEAGAAFLLGKLYVVGGLHPDGTAAGAIDVYDPTTRRWTTGPAMPHPVGSPGIAVLDGQVYVVGGCSDDAGCGVTTVQVYDPVAQRWSDAPDYPVATSWLGCGGIGTRLYCAGGATSQHNLAQGYRFDPASAAWTPIADMPGPLWGASVAAQGGRLLLSGGVLAGAVTNAGFGYDPADDTWTALPNSNEASYGAAGACGLYRIGGWLDQSEPDLTQTVQVLPGYGGCSGNGAPGWLSATPTTATLRPGASMTVTVTMNAAAQDVPQPGSYAGALTIAEDTPYPASWLPVTMTVAPPATWGELTGTVTGTACDGTTTPLPGAVVSAVDRTQQTTVATDRTGRYDMWLAGSKSLTVYAALDGWTPISKTTKITKGRATTLDLRLSPDHGC